ncbi:hypothetical protein B0H13DRAFT_1880184 [Mycena leptocephala]|nr:hypothetical protein B0H13DRAFT_1880184 [Mycena leptocephala]
MSRSISAVDELSRVVVTFTHYGLEGPPKGKETAGKMTIRTEVNLARVADIVGDIDGRLGCFESVAKNWATEREIQERTARYGEPAEEVSVETETDSDGAFPHDDTVRSASRGSVGTVDVIEGPLDDAATTLLAHTVRVEALEARMTTLDDYDSTLVTPLPLRAMVQAVSDQFHVIAKDRKTLNGEIAYQADAQAKVNKNYDNLIADLQAKIRALESADLRPKIPVAHGPTPPSYPLALSHACGWSPPSPLLVPGGKCKCKQACTTRPGRSYIVMGPAMDMPISPPEVLQCYMNDVLPAFGLPEPRHLTVLRDPVHCRHLRIFLPAADARALVKAWTNSTRAGNITMLHRPVPQSSRVRRGPTRQRKIDHLIVQYAGGPRTDRNGITYSFSFPQHADISLQPFAEVPQCLRMWERKVQSMQQAS